MEKKDIGRKMKNLRLMLSEPEKASAAEEVFSQLEKSAAFALADNICMYNSLPDELSTRVFLAKWHGRKHFYLPRVNGVNLDILPYSPDKLHIGAYDIDEPDGDETFNPENLDLIIVPAVAFDKNGNRLGRGKGFYDRLLSSTGATTIGVAYDFQLLESLPTEPHDIPVDMVITQSSVIIRNKTKR